MVFARTQQPKESRKHAVPATCGSHALRPRWDRPPPILPFLLYGGARLLVCRFIVNKLLFKNAFRNAAQLECSKPWCLQVSTFVFCVFYLLSGFLRIAPGTIAIAKNNHNPARAMMRGPTGAQKRTPALLRVRIALQILIM